MQSYSAGGKRSLPPRFIWVTGMPRSGSTWVYNVARALVLAGGHPVMPATMMTNELECIETANRECARPRQRGDPTWMFKLHAQLSGSMPDSLLICTYRDPRDALISYWRFMRCDFPTALEAAVQMTGTIDHYRKLPAEAKLDLEYRDIVAEPVVVAERLARALGLAVAGDAIAGAVDAFTKSAVQDIIARREAAGGREAEPSGATPTDWPNADGSRRIFDPATGFQSGHVSDYVDGQWRALLGAPEQAQIDARLGPWLRANGFA